MPAELAMGLILKASSNPKAVVKSMYRRAEQELEDFGDNIQVSCIEVA